MCACIACMLAIALLQQAHGQQTHGHYASSDGSCSSQDYAPVLNLREERWVPYRHTNGVAIYHQRQTKCSGLWGDDEGPDAAAGLGVGSEYMASSIVRGSPDECLAVLMDMASNTTILGPASTIELLEDADERQVGLLFDAALVATYCRKAAAAAV
eukprot:GHRQ01015578.1.p2 GENE.GHRQ01015578.1~~GHRQ01015578.1.p2  ORF type:complete len:156 (-),score=63.73 GHRQ01015578.1:692-1159(-)